MKAWRLDRLGGTLRLEDAPIPEPRPGSVIVKIEASALMSYLKSYVEGRLRIYSPPDGPFTPGGNAIGIVHGVGREVYHVKAGQRVVVSSHIVADENAPEPAQFLFGITAGPAGKALQTDWRDGTLAEYALVPKSCITPIEGLELDRRARAFRSAAIRGALRWPSARASRGRRNDRHHGCNGCIWKRGRTPFARSRCWTRRRRRTEQACARRALTTRRAPRGDGRAFGRRRSRRQGSARRWRRQRTPGPRHHRQCSRPRRYAGGAQELAPWRAARADGKHECSAPDFLCRRDAEQP